MPVPDFQLLMLPAFRAFAVGVETPLSVIREQVAAVEGLSAEEVRELLPSGRQSRFGNRVNWAVIYMECAGLLARVRRGVYRLTTDGEYLLSQAPSRIDLDVLGAYPTYANWSRQAKVPPPVKDAQADSRRSSSETPEEELDRKVGQLNRPSKPIFCSGFAPHLRRSSKGWWWICCARWGTAAAMPPEAA